MFFCFLQTGGCAACGAGHKRRRGTIEGLAGQASQVTAVTSGRGKPRGLRRRGKRTDHVGKLPGLTLEGLFITQFHQKHSDKQGAIYLTR